MRKGFLLILTLFITTVLLALPKAESATISLSPTDDATVGNWYPTGNTNSDTLWIQASEALDDSGNFSISRAYLKFDLGDIPDSAQIINADFRLYLKGYSGGTVNFWHASSDNWTESWDSISWNNQPAVDGFLAQLEISDSSSSLKYTDITDSWDSTVDLIDNYLSIAVTMVNESPDEPMWAEFISQENFDFPFNYRPLLTIEYEETTSVPLPGAAWLLGSGFLCIVGYRRISKFKKSSC